MRRIAFLLCLRRATTGGDVFTAISAAKAGVPIDAAIVAMQIERFMTGAPPRSSLHGFLFVSLRCRGKACNPANVRKRKYPACVAL